MGFTGRVMRSGLRVGLLAIAVKVSVDNDVWSLQTDESYAAYHKFTKNILPGTIVYREKLPSKDDMEADVSEVTEKWNRNVNFAISYLSQLRSKIAQWTSTDASAS